MDNTARVKPGDRIRPAAGTWNELLGLVDESKKRGLAKALAGGPPGYSLAPAHTCYVQNRTEEDVDEGAVLAIDDVAYAANTYPGDFSRKPMFKGVVPSSTTDNFAVLIEPAKAGPEDTPEEGAFALAVVGGLVVADVSFTDGAHLFATPKASDATKLASAESGPAIVLWRASSGTGTDSCVLLIDRSGGGGGGFSGLDNSYGNGGGGVTVTSDATWTATSTSVTLDPGTYLLFYTAYGTAQINTGSSGGTTAREFSARLYNTTASAAVDGSTVVVCYPNNHADEVRGSPTNVLVVTLASTSTIRVEAFRAAAVGTISWVQSTIDSCNIGWVRLDVDGGGGGVDIIDGGSFT